MWSTRWPTVLLVIGISYLVRSEGTSGGDTASTTMPPGDSHDHEDHFDLSMFDFFSDDNTKDDGHLEQHIKEDIGIEKSVDKMSETEKDWYYFKLHDTNSDYMLDGLELYKAWQHHYIEHMGHDGMAHDDSENQSAEMKKFLDSQEQTFISMVDNILATQDANNDGYLDYIEYMLAKQSAEKEEEKNKKPDAKKHK